ncbi:hypothetical protein AK812_SmicGene18211 [Symbiodinium microadriaticum]|uniref:Uncharacterized protein n=1 Tax=Symbiodinium microadriaticum TaxID=2951 RepID=A0A1Q9DVP2_SYMMI|nr:hypothetical protein AK812_SmicGene18211 [Symbiodinium microadriaticum]
MFAFSSHGSVAESETSAEESSDVSFVSDDDALVLEEVDLDGSAGQNALAIPEATAHFDVSGADVKPGNPPKWRDLTRILLPGDVVNILGGNVWGHCGLVTKAIEVFQFPVLFAKVPANGKDQGSPISVVELDFRVDVFIFEVLQSASNMPTIFLSQIGVVVHPNTRDVCMVRRVRGGVLLRNSHSGEPLIVQILLSPFNEVTLERSLLAQSISEVMSAPETRWSPTTAVRAFFRHAHLKPSRYGRRNRRRRLAAQLQHGWLVRPVCSTVPPRVWQKYLHKRSQLPRKPFPSHNDEGAEVTRGMRSGSHLLYCGRDCLEEEEESFCCPSWNTPTRQCGPFKGRQCPSCLRSQWALPSDDADPQVAFAEDVLRMVPVKDDRVLPEELVTNLLATGVWTQVNLDDPLPFHRQSASAGDEGPALRSCACVLPVLSGGSGGSPDAILTTGLMHVRGICTILHRSTLRSQAEYSGAILPTRVITMIRGFVFALVWSQAAAGPLSGLLASLTGHDNATCADTHHACATSFAAFFPETAATHATEHFLPDISSSSVADASAAHHDGHMDQFDSSSLLTGRRPRMFVSFEKK